MVNPCSRRSLLKFAGIMFPLAQLPLSGWLMGLNSASAGGDAHTLPLADVFPSHPPELVREMVTVSHFDLKRVKEIVEARPALARASWDWGFGDWETALGAASHMGNHAIAEYLIANGARPSLFSAAMLGQLDVVKAFVAASPGVQRVRGPHGISLLAHAKMGGVASRPVVEFLQSLAGADVDPLIPLSDDDAAKLAGTYVFGLGVTQRIDVAVEQRKGLMSMYSPLTWTRKGAMGRPLVHLGDHMFYPAACPSVRIHFAEDKNGKDGMMVMTVSDPELLLTAKRNPPGK